MNPSSGHTSIGRQGTSTDVHVSCIASRVVIVLGRRRIAL
jgi:hypothetical protein